MIEIKYRIKHKADFESIFSKVAENSDQVFSDDFVIEGNHDITYKDLKDTCEIIGYDRLLISQEDLDDILNGELGYIDTFYMDLIGLTHFKRDFNYHLIFNGKNPDELVLDNDGTLRLWFD